MSKYLRERYEGILDMLPADDAQVVRDRDQALFEEWRSRRVFRNKAIETAGGVLVIGSLIAAFALIVSATFSEGRIASATAECEAQQQELRDRCLDCLLKVAP